MLRMLLDDLTRWGYVALMALATAAYVVCVYAPVRVVRWLRDRTWP